MGLAQTLGGWFGRAAPPPQPQKTEAPDTSGLAEILGTADTPLGALAVGAEDLAAAIAACPRPGILRRAWTRADAVGDHRWALACERRLLALDPDEAIAERHVLRLTWVRAFSAAEAALKAHDARVPAPRKPVLAHRVACGLGQRETADRLLHEIAAALPGTLAEAQAVQVMAWLDHGYFIEAAALAQEALRTSPTDTGIRSAHLWTVLVSEGPQAALAALDASADLDPLVAATLRAAFLKAAGRAGEATDLLLAQIAETPRASGLYGALFDVGQQADRLDAVIGALDAAAAVAPGLPAIEEVRCAILIDQNAVDEADPLLARIRTRSDWGYLAMRLTRACQVEGPEVARTAFDAARAAGVPEEQVAVFYALYLYYYRGQPDDLAEALALIEDLLATRQSDAGLIAIYLRLLVANDRDEDARAVFDALPSGLRRCALPARFEPYFHARAGDHAAAAAAWPGLLARSGHPALSARSAFPEEIRVRFDGKPGQVLLFLTVFNGREYIDWFLAYYRALGVDHFFIIDNGSTDGTYEVILEAGDVSVFRQAGSFSDAACGVFWVNHLMRRYAVGHWAFHVDMDEAFVFPGSDAGRSLRDLIAYLEAGGYGTMAGMMLDIYPDRLDPDPGGDPFAASRYIDTDYVFNRNELPPYVFIQGGVRARLTGRSLLMTKAPLVKVTADLAYLDNNHTHTHLPVADITCAVLHYKFIGDLRGRIDEAIDRGEHFLGARFYRALKRGLDGDGAAESSAQGPSLVGPGSVEYGGTGHLVELGLLQSSTEWDDWTNK